MNKIYIGIMVLIFAVLGSAIIFKQNQQTSNGLDYADIGGEFTLKSNKGDVHLSDYKGKLVLVYFGYMFCPDVCPTNLIQLKLALNKLNKNQLEQVQAIFVSVDPDRDTPEKLAEYAKHFHDNLIGVTSDKETIAKVAKAYQVAYQRVDMPNSAMGYAMDHSSVTYVIDQNGKTVDLIAHASPVQQIYDIILKNL